MHNKEFVKLHQACQRSLEVDATRTYAKSEAMFRRCLDAGTDRLFLIGKAIDLRNAALDRYEEAVGRIEPKRSLEMKEADPNTV